MSNNNYVLIMAGGKGSRFWPISRNNYPKQFIDVLGIGKSLLQMTYQRFASLCPLDNIFIITNSQYVQIVKDQLLEIKEGNIISEPSRNNTASSIAYASFKIANLNSNANIVVAPSDHFILYEEVFIQKLQKALYFAAENDALLTLGITPTRPDTGYGYIKFDKCESEGVHKVIGFTEKPDLEQAQKLLASNEYLWNAGIFIWNVNTILSAFLIHCPEIFALFNKGENLYNTTEEEDFILKYYPTSPNISIDYAVMEKAENIFTIPAEIGWSDLGTWGSLFEIAGKDENQNVLSSSQVYLQDTQNCIVHLPENKLAVIRGAKDFIIVDDGAVLLIYPKSLEQDIKEVTQQVNSAFGEKFL